MKSFSRKKYVLGIIVILFGFITTYAAPPTTYNSVVSPHGNFVSNASWSGNPGLSCAPSGNDTYNM